MSINRIFQLAMLAALVLASGVANAQRQPTRPTRTHVSSVPADTEAEDGELPAGRESELVSQRQRALQLAASSATALDATRAELAQLRREQAENRRLLAQQAEALRNLSARPQTETPQPQARTRATWTSPTTVTPPSTPQPTVYRSHTQAGGAGGGGLAMNCSLPANVLDTLFIGGVRGLRSGQSGTITLMVHGMYSHGFSAWVNGHAVTPVYGGSPPCALVETNGGDSAAIPFVPPIPADGITWVVGPTGQEAPSEVRLEVYSVLPGVTRLQRSCTIIIPNVSPGHPIDVREMNGQVMADEHTCSR